MRATIRLTILIAAIHLCSWAAALDSECKKVSDYCFIDGLPDDAVSKGNVHTLRKQASNVKLNLKCSCSSLSPQWYLHHLKSDSTNTPIISDILCVNNSMPCNDPNTEYISKDNISNGLFVYNISNFTITESTVVSCYSTQKNGAVLVVYLEDPETPTVSPTAVSSTNPSSSCSLATTTILTTSTVPTVSTVTLTTTVQATKCSNVIISATVTETYASCSSQLIRPTMISSKDKPDPTVTIAGILDSVGGTPVLALLPIVLILLVISTLFCVLVIYIRITYKKKIKELNEQIKYERRNSNSSSIKGSSLDRLLSTSSTPLPSRSTTDSPLTISSHTTFPNSTNV